MFNSIEPEICMKMLRNLSEKLRAKFPASIRGYSMVKIACLDNSFSEVSEVEANPVEGQSQQQKDEKKRKRKGQKAIKKIRKPIGHILKIFDVHARAKMS